MRATARARSRERLNCVVNFTIYLSHRSRSMEQSRPGEFSVPRLLLCSPPKQAFRGLMSAVAAHGKHGHHGQLARVRNENQRPPRPPRRNKNVLVFGYRPRNRVGPLDDHSCLPLGVTPALHKQGVRDGVCVFEGATINSALAGCSSALHYI